MESVIKAYLKRSQRLDDVLPDDVFFLPNQAICAWLELTIDQRKDRFKTLKQKQLIPPVPVKGLNREYLEALWEYEQLIKTSDRPNAYLMIDKVMEYLRNEQQT
jgi:hypothetical protein